MCWLISLILLGLLIGGIILIDFIESLGLIISVVLGFALGMFLLIWPINYFCDVVFIQQYGATKVTIEQARNKDIDPLERVELQKKIIEINNTIAIEKYWNQTILDEWIPDEIMDLEPLK
jgi:hypothetical protein